MGELDLAISRFRPDSDLVRANTAAGRWVSACDWLVTATEVALMINAVGASLTSVTVRV